MKPIYLDYNATTPVLPQVVDAMLPYLREHFGNPSSGHVYGSKALDAVEKARNQVASLINCSCEEVVFTSGGTEANNIAIHGVTDAKPVSRHVITSAIEHPATANPCRRLEQNGFKVSWVSVDQTGQILLDEVASLVGEGASLITIMHANNEVGTLQPISQISKMARCHGAVVHTDAAQSVGKIPTDVDEMGVDLLSIAGHKLYAPKGVGALYIRRGTPIGPFTLGAGHERGLRPGTENVSSIVGLGLACEIAQKTMTEESDRVRVLRDKLFSDLKENIPDLALNGHMTQRLPNTLNVSFPKVRGSALLELAPEIAASTGSACHEGGEEPSGVLVKMGMNTKSALGAVRLSLGRSTNKEQVLVAANAIIRAYKALSQAM